MTQPDLAAELARLRAAATPDRWTWNWKYGTIDAVDINLTRGAEVFRPGEHPARELSANAEFSAWCANNAAAIVARLQRADELEREVAELRGASESGNRWLIWFTNSLRWKDFMRSRGCSEDQVSEVDQLREQK